MIGREIVRLEGGGADGREISVLRNQRLAAVIVAETEKVYPAGTFGTADSPEVVATVIEFETYERGDDGVFRPRVSKLDYWLRDTEDV